MRISCCDYLHISIMSLSARKMFVVPVSMKRNALQFAKGRLALNSIPKGSREFCCKCGKRHEKSRNIPPQQLFTADPAGTTTTTTVAPAGSYSSYSINNNSDETLFYNQGRTLFPTTAVTFATTGRRFLSTTATDNAISNNNNMEPNDSVMFRQVREYNTCNFCDITLLLLFFHKI